MEADFTGWATKAGLECSDGRTIMPDAFKHMDKKKVPLVWQHGHDKITNVLGHAILEARPEGLVAHGFFNDSPEGKHARTLVQSGNIDSLSIWANQLTERAKQVFHGFVKEVSLVLSGANPGAKITNVQLAHGDDLTDLEDEAIIHTGLTFGESEKEAPEGDAVKHAATAADVAQNETMQEIWDGFDDDEKSFVHWVVDAALTAQGSTAGHSDSTKDEGDLTHKEGSTDMGTRNVFDQTETEKPGDTKTLSHDDMNAILFDARDRKISLASAVKDYAIAHGITDIETLFPDAKMIGDKPDFDKRRTEWVSGVLSSTRKTPFTRIKTMTADITQDAARALGYIKGEFKKEEWFGVTKRTTGPKTIYKKQKLDRDDVVDITDFDVVSWMKGEMRIMIEEEIARAILIGDGRDVASEDKITDPAGASSGDGIRSIYNDHEFYVTTINANVSDANSKMTEVVDAIISGRRFYKGTGTPTFYTTEPWIARFLTTRDNDGHRYWRTLEELAMELRVSSIVAVEPMETIPDLIGLIVNLQDYNVGADKGGELNLFDDFDLDYNQLKYLIETRLSGALVKIKSALKIMSVAAGAALVFPLTAPTMVQATYVVTIPTQTGVVYKNKDTNATLSAGAQAALTAGTTLNVIAVPASASYYFADNADDEWTFSRPAA